MNSFSKEGEGKKKVTEVKIFPVPFALGEIKTNISINTNIPSKPSKEQIINQAIQFHLKGNIPEASKYYLYCINQGFNDHRIFSNYGAISQGLGKLKEAEKWFRKAIEIKPDFAEAYSNLGNIFRDHGKLKKAELSYRKAIEIKPDFADAYSNLGNVLGNLGKSKEALDSYLKAIYINPTLSNIYPTITTFLKYSDPSELNKSKLKYIINILLEKNNVPHKELFNAFKFGYNNELINKLEKLDSDISQIDLIINDKIIINALKKIIFTDQKLETLLTKIRRNISNVISKDIKTTNYSDLQFIIALGEQCFLNEYIYSVTEEENISVNTIINRCIDGELSETNISILSCYFPLYKLLDQIPLLTSFTSSNQSFKELMELQITEPIKEIELSKNIKSLGTINNNISKKVKSQYEENPYPRWRYGNPSKKQKFAITQLINSSIKPNFISDDLGNKQVKILVAGCGTGQHILHTQNYRNAHVIGIDLSSSSLAYAQRKINEFEIDNVELIQMDILEVGLLKEQFDIIESSGVLHHMEDPLKGLKALLGILKPNGYLHLGLYSELARQEIVKARNYIINKQIEPSKDNIRNFRQKVLSDELRDVKSLKNIGDFYSLSQCRDLCFHIQEHRFTINQLREMLQSNELKFLGFSLPEPIKSVYKQYYPEDKKQTNLQNWEKFEEKHPNTFARMYQFWCSKKEN